MTGKKQQSLHLPMSPPRGGVDKGVVNSHSLFLNNLLKVLVCELATKNIFIFYVTFSYIEGTIHI